MSKRLQDYDFSYPAELVAQVPLALRSASRMMVLPRDLSDPVHRRFVDLPEFLRPGDLLVANDTAVFPSRLFARKPSGGKVEVFLLRERGGGEWSAFLSPARGLARGMTLEVFCRESGRRAGAPLTIRSLEPDDFRVAFASAQDEAQTLDGFGETPLPPYIERPLPRSEDRDRYQTVFAKNVGAVAAPTAGLHFDATVKSALRDRGVDWTCVTLHVGAGTFLPVKTDSVDDHPMHEEIYEIPEAALSAVEACRSRGGRIFAVGTTSLRALESWAATGERRGATRLFIRPGFQFRAIDGLLTNFHQPKSTLLMLVSALAGRERILAAYQEAIRERYRLFSYGDCMLMLP